MKPPRTIDFASIALIVQALAMVGVALALRAEKSAYTSWLFKNGTSTVTKKKFTTSASTMQQLPGKVLDDLHTQVDNAMKSSLLTSILFAFILVVIVFALRRTRGASPARWAVVVLAVLQTVPLQMLSIASNLPTGLKIAQFVVGLASTVSLVMLFVPQSRQYFRDVRAAVAETLPPRPARSGGRGGLFGGGGGGLFGPRPAARSAEPRVVDAEPVASVDMTKRPDKRRAEADAVAKGAALARSRAKAAAKSRRTED